MFSLSNLSPEREPFDLGDGRTIYFLNKQDFDFQQKAAWDRLQEEMKRANKDRENAHNEQKHTSISKRVNQLCLEYIALILPDLPKDILDSLSAGQIDQLTSMCISVASGTLRGVIADQEDIDQALQIYPEMDREFLASLTRQQMAILLKKEEEPEKN